MVTWQANGLSEVGWHPSHLASTAPLAGAAVSVTTTPALNEWVQVPLRDTPLAVTVMVQLIPPRFEVTIPFIVLPVP
jgi:hypothetical protein